jgi:hypothetical protein
MFNCRVCNYSTYRSEHSIEAATNSNRLSFKLICLLNQRDRPHHPDVDAQPAHAGVWTGRIEMASFFPA